MILTIDIGGTNVKYGLCDAYGVLFFKKGDYTTPKTTQDIVQSILFFAV